MRDDFLDALVGRAGNFEREGNVFENGFAWEQFEILKHHADLAAQKRDVAIFNMSDVPAPNFNLSLGWAFLRIQHLGESRFPRSALSDNRNKLSGTDMQMHIAHSCNVWWIDFADVF